MERLEALLAEIVAVRDSDGSRRLCLDVWGWGIKHGEAEGLALGRVVLACVKEYVRHRAELRHRVPGGVQSG